VGLIGKQKEKWNMNTAAIEHRRSFLPTFNLLLASGAAVLAVIAIVGDDVGSATPAPTARTSGATITGPAHPMGTADVGIPCDELVYTRC
jgi:hypothetical protein